LLVICWWWLLLHSAAAVIGAIDARYAHLQKKKTAIDRVVGSLSSVTVLVWFMDLVHGLIDQMLG
jgi:hypothetical protein